MEEDQEDNSRSYSNGGDGGGSGGGGGNNGRSLKKAKQRKVPQRGLGVAQLEKIRLEEQEKRDVNGTPISSSSSSTKSSYLNNFHHSSSTTTTPLPSRPPPPPEFRPPLPLQYMDVKLPSTVPLGGFEAGWPSVSLSGHGNLPKLWNSHEFDFENDTFGVEPGLPFLPNLAFDQSSPIWSLPNWGQRPSQYHHQPPMVNIPSGTSSTHVPHFSIEPPSNQNYSANGVLARPEEKIVGMKRPYPFSLDIPDVPAFNCKLPTFAELSANARPTFESGSGFNFDVGNSFSREVPSCSASNSEEPNLKKTNKGHNKHLDGHFLTLATPIPTSSPPSLFNSSTSFPFHYQECPEFESPPLQGNIEDQMAIPPGYRLYNQQKQPLYSFFLPSVQIGQTTARIQNSQEVGENIDLNLKL